MVCSLIVALSAFTLATAYISSPVPNRQRHWPKCRSSNELCMSSAVEAQSTTDEGPTEELSQRCRYVATNRFAVRRGQEAKFEKRWTTRKSNLATLDGFRYFHLMRRVKLNNDGTSTYDGGHDSDRTAPSSSSSSPPGNYVSFTIWEEKRHFNAWRKGDAFKEAHGGKSIGAFLSTMVNSAMVLQGPPRPAFYDGLFSLATVPTAVPVTVDGWRDVKADGEHTLPAECFVACNPFFIPPENAAAFEERWSQRDSKLHENEGFVAFIMLRRDGTAKGHGTVPVNASDPSYVSTSIWRDREAFEKWRRSQSFKDAHGSQGKSKSQSSQSKPPLWSQPPRPIFYEGTLVITSAQGA